MLKFVVKSMAKQDDLTIVVVEPVEQPLLFEDDIPPGCIQHIIYALHENEDSKEDCVRLCNILSNVYMDDYNSRKSTISFNISFHVRVYFIPIQFQLIVEGLSESTAGLKCSANYLRSTKI